MNWKREMYRRWAGLVDGATFSLVNAFQHRHHQQASTPEELAIYLGRWRDRVEEYFSGPSLAIEIGLAEGGMRRWECPSPISGEFPENNRCVFEFYPASSDWARPTMFLLHGLMSASATGYRKWARKINERGWHAVFVHLPYHYGRRPRGYVSGELAVGPNGIRTVDGVRQAVVECRGLMEVLARVGVPYFGAWGMSYGGWVASLLAATEPRVRCGLLLEPIVDFEHAIWFSPASKALRHHLARNGVSRGMAADLDHLISPIFHKPLCDPDRVVVVAAEFDRVSSPELLEAFAKSWGCRYRCYMQGHVGYRLMREAFREWSEDLAPGLDG